ncbi:uncharacterized protein [Physcomitrium patens]|uniref:Uncharacterized protein n=2 Tax=Physcomitrium patens TaxID=3218 RepID=A0A2K1K859_PHYPA|nr:uncharacterized protein LOC112285873 [Physcomitrium patens]PNR49965.1 hypothetical protein PHYPA_011862 [Physcomitrium patens]|eukprot:XP_024382951.1 uncharacterized protein LOC112285873 [Physcomitrella patens]
MPGLRYQLGMSPFTDFLECGDVNMPASRYMGGISRDREMARPQNVPQSTKAVRRAQPQWLKPIREDSRVNFLGTKHWGSPTVVPDTSYESDDLQAMVHDFIENDSADCMDGVEGDGGSPVLTLTENLQILTQPQSSLERELLTDVQRLLLNLNEDTDLICDTNDADCKGTCIKRLVVKHLKMASYSASVCKSKWLSSGRVPGGEYEYIDVVFEGTDRLIVDIHFQTQFEIARPTSQYSAALMSLPTVFVGTIAKLEQVLRLMSEAAKVSLVQNDMHLPPWRTLDYMRVKWLSDYETLAPTPYRGSARLQWRDKRSSAATSEARQCGDELRRTKHSLRLETKGLGLFNLSRERSSRANLLLRSAA